MPLRVFLVPARDDGSAQRELNGFLGSHRILAIDRRFVDQGENSFWSFCVDYLESSAGSHGGGSGSRGAVNRTTKVDYREVLSPEEFAVFAQLRDWRKQVSQAAAVPVYTVFTNEQLARMVQTRATTKAALEQIAGVGDARIEKYGLGLLEFLSLKWSEPDAPGGPTV